MDPRESGGQSGAIPAFRSARCGLRLETSMKQTLRATNLPELGERLEGKVRDIYLRGRDVVLVATDRHSSFDRIIADVPGKGEVLNRLSAYWFEQTKDIVPNHVLEPVGAQAVEHFAL